MKKLFSIVGPWVVFLGGSGLMLLHNYTASNLRPNLFTPKPPKLVYSSWKTGPIDVALVFGRIGDGCADASHEFIFEVSAEANHAGVEPKLAAALVAVESRCDPLAISPAGALGLTQVRPKIWKDKYDFEKTNLLNRKENLHVGFSILAGLMNQYGSLEGLRRYNGTGQGCGNCDGAYTKKILDLTGRRP